MIWWRDNRRVMANIVAKNQLVRPLQFQLSSTGRRVDLSARNMQLWSEDETTEIIQTVNETENEKL